MGLCFLFKAVSIDDHAVLAQFCKDEEIEFVVVGPEAPLAAGKVHISGLQHAHLPLEV